MQWARPTVASISKCADRRSLMKKEKLLPPVRDGCVKQATTDDGGSSHSHHGEACLRWPDREQTSDLSPSKYKSKENLSSSFLDAARSR